MSEVDPPSVLLVGTFGGGGIHRYVDAQREALADRAAVTAYDMGCVDAGDPPVLATLWRSLLAALRFPVRPLRAGRPDVVHVHTSHAISFYRAAWYVLVAAAGWRRPVVVHVHGSAFDEFVAAPPPGVGRLQSAVFGLADRVVALSPYWRDALARRCPPAKLTVIPNAVSPGAYDPVYGADPPRVVLVSNLIERKGVPELVAAVDRLPPDETPPFELHVAGAGPLAPAVESLAAADDRVTYHGYVSEAEKRALLSRGSVFVLPAHAEGLPIAMLEGMAGGNAVVATRVGGIPDAVGPENGALVAPGDPEALAAALRDRVAAPAETAAMGRRNRRLVGERYRWAAVADRLLDLYADLRADAAAGAA